MSKVVVIASGKGGVGKSTLSFNIAYEIARLQSGSVILISTDPGRGAEYLTEVDDVTAGWLDYLRTRDMTLEEVLLKSRYDNLYVIPSIEDPFAQEGDFRSILRKLLLFKKEVENSSSVGFVLIDTPGSIVEHHYFYAKLFRTVLVTVPEGIDRHGTSQLLKINKVLERERAIRHLIVNKVLNHREVEQTRRDLEEKMRSEGLDVELEVVGAVPASKEVMQATEARKPVSLHAPRSEAARQIRCIASRVFAMTTGRVEDIKGENRIRTSGGMLENLISRIRRAI